MITATIRLDRPSAAAALDQAPVQVAIAIEQHRGVLAVAVTALLARPGGRYAVQLAGGPGARLILVTVGLYDDAAGLVEVSGAGLAPGQAVQVPAQ
jgi:hypothetical protein